MNLLEGKLTAIDVGQTLRFLGGTGRTVPEELATVYGECEKLILDAVKPRAVWREYPLDRGADGTLDLGFARLTSQALSRNLEGCDRIVLFAATVGPAVDRLILKYERLSPARAALLQAMGGSAAEHWCEDVDAHIRALYGATRPRFSCGYGDLPLTLQHDIFRALDATKLLGLTLTDGGLMSPTKSVTAIIGIKRKG